MDFYLLNCRPLRITPIIELPNDNTLAIYTAFNPKQLTCCEVVFMFTQENIQCMMFEETPRQLDPVTDIDILDMFDSLIETNNFSEANLPPDITVYIADNALDFAQQLVTH